MHPDVPSTGALRDETVVGMAGTFDVENYGDLLFPLIAAEALQRRDRRIRIAPFSANAKSEASWPFDVGSMDEMISSLSSFSAMLIGGGQLIRFDKAYPVAVPRSFRLPIDYWLMPAVLAALSAKPVIWNGIGAWTDSPRASGYDELIRQLFAASRYIGVRDAASREQLARIAPAADIEFLPDTAFGLSRLWPIGEESADFARWRESLGLEGRYVVVQASVATDRHRARIGPVMNSLGVDRAVLLPIGWCHGDRAEAIGPMAGRLPAGPQWLPPRLTAEIIARSDFLFASSLHACITALSYGVPVARAPRCSDRKFELLGAFEGIVRIEDGRAMQRRAERGRGIEPRIVEYQDRLDQYWDQVADAVLRPSVEKGDRARRLVLDALFRQLADRTPAGLAGQGRSILRGTLLHLRGKSLSLGSRARALREDVATAARNLVRRRTSSASDGATRRGMSPEAGRPGARREPVLNVQRIADFEMNGEPYRWARIDRLFSEPQAARLAASFPRDKFKNVAGYDGEKGYQYVARSLIHMGASEPSHPKGLDPLWLALAEDLLSPAYRDALSAASGLDLSSAQMEANVIHYGPGSWLGPHVDLKEKILTHIIYFNEGWDPRDGGCLNILRSRDPEDKVAEIPPLVGSSSLLVRSDRSWHSVSPVSSGCTTSRRSLNVIFHLPGSISTMWPPRDRARLRDYAPAS